jgi:hypothetical protein
MSTADEFNELSSVGGCLIEWKEACSGAFTGGGKMETQVFTFATSWFVPVAIGFFGRQGTNVERRLSQPVRTVQDPQGTKRQAVADRVSKNSTRCPDTCRA